MKSSIPFAKITFLLLTIILFIYGIIAAKQFLFPITFGILISYLLYPIANFLEKNSFPRILSIIISILVAIVVVGAIFLLFYRQFVNMLDEFASLRQKANENIEAFQQNLQSFLGLQNNRLEQFLKDQVSQFFGKKNQIALLFTATTDTIFKIVILPVYVFLFLYYRTKFAYFILKIVDKKNERTALNILREISTVAAKYMGGVAIVVLILCVLNSTGLLIIGVEYAILLGIISAFFNFIPYFGTLLGGAVPLLFVLLTADDPVYYAIRVVILFMIIQFTENNILTPNIVGGNVKINPFFIIVGLIVGGMVWGIPGMLVIVPFLAIARIICSNIKGLQPYSFLLGPKGTQRHSITMRKIRDLFVFRKNHN